MQSEQFFSYILARINNIQLDDDDDVRFVVDQHSYLDSHWYNSTQVDISLHSDLILILN